MAASLSLFGAGRLGTTLARLWQDQQTFAIKQLLTQHRHTALAASDFIGLAPATALSDAKQLCSDQHWLLACPDSQLESAVATLLELQLVSPGGIVFHCSGALSSELLAPLREQGISCASIHPAHSFSAPRDSIRQFSGSHCACEGDSLALALLMPAFEAIGAQLFTLEAAQKRLYHAGSVMACNYMVSLLQASLDTFALAGIEQDQARALLAPLLQSTLDNVINKGSAESLTGPIVRGDVELVEQQLNDLQQRAPYLAEIYRSLGQNSIAIAARGGLALTKQQQFEDLFKRP